MDGRKLLAYPVDQTISCDFCSLIERQFTDG